MCWATRLSLFKIPSVLKLHRGPSDRGRFHKPQLDWRRNCLRAMSRVNGYCVAKGSLFFRKGMDFPRPTRAALVQSISESFLRGFSEIEMMQPVRHSHSVNLPVGLNLSRFRWVFIQPEMCPLIMVVVEISLQTFPQMIVIHDDQVIKTFPPNAPDESFAISILPRRPIGG